MTGGTSSPGHPPCSTPQNTLHRSHEVQTDSSHSRGCRGSFGAHCVRVRGTLARGGIVERKKRIAMFHLHLHLACSQQQSILQGFSSRASGAEHDGVAVDRFLARWVGWALNHSSCLWRVRGGQRGRGPFQGLTQVEDGFNFLTVSPDSLGQSHILQRMNDNVELRTAHEQGLEFGAYQGAREQLQQRVRAVQQLIK